MQFSKVFQCLIAKAERKGRSKQEVQILVSWLTGYTTADLEELQFSDITYGDFFRNAPHMNPNRNRIKGKICGIVIQDIEDPLMRDIRYLDKLVDDVV